MPESIDQLASEAAGCTNCDLYKDATQTVLYENPLLGTLTHDGRSLYFIDDLGIPPPPPTQANEFGQQMPRNHPASRTPLLMPCRVM